MNLPDLGAVDWFAVLTGWLLLGLLLASRLGRVIKQVEKSRPRPETFTADTPEER